MNRRTKQRPQITIVTPTKDLERCDIMHHFGLVHQIPNQSVLPPLLWLDLCPAISNKFSLVQFRGHMECYDWQKLGQNLIGRAAMSAAAAAWIWRRDGGGLPIPCNR